MIRCKFCILTGVMCPYQGIASRDGHSVDHLIGDVDFGNLGCSFSMGKALFFVLQLIWVTF